MSCSQTQPSCTLQCLKFCVILQLLGDIILRTHSQHTPTHGTVQHAATLHAGNSDRQTIPAAAAAAAAAGYIKRKQAIMFVSFMRSEHSVLLAYPSCPVLPQHCVGNYRKCAAFCLLDSVQCQKCYFSKIITMNVVNIAARMVPCSMFEHWNWPKQMSNCWAIPQT